MTIKVILRNWFKEYKIMKRALLISFIFVFIGAIASPALLHGADNAHRYILVMDDIDRNVELLVNHNKNQNKSSDHLSLNK